MNATGAEGRPSLKPEGEMWRMIIESRAALEFSSRLGQKTVLDKMRYNSYNDREEKGTELREPYSAPLEDGIFELRCKLGSNITRALYFFYVGKRIVVTNGFIKKTQKTPPGEIKLAKDRRKDWIERQEREKENAGKKGRR